MPKEENTPVGSVSIMISQKSSVEASLGKSYIFTIYSLNTSTYQVPFYVIEMKLGIQNYLHEASLLVKNTC